MHIKSFKSKGSNPPITYKCLYNVATFDKAKHGTHLLLIQMLIQMCTQLSKSKATNPPIAYTNAYTKLHHLKK